VFHRLDLVLHFFRRGIASVLIEKTKLSISSKESTVASVTSESKNPSHPFEQQLNLHLLIHFLLKQPSVKNKQRHRHHIIHSYVRP
jgi:hypothetical protein